MRSYLIVLFVVFFATSGFSQHVAEDWGWWNELHDWKTGDPGWREMMTISPGYFGPNALPVPEVKKGYLDKETEFEVMLSNHFHAGDPTRDLSAKLYIPFAKNKIAIEMYGVVLEHFTFSEEIRNERISRIKDGKGFAIGDFYFSTLVQLSKDRKFPNTLFRFAAKTASGNQLEGARFTDTPGYFFDLSFSKNFNMKNGSIFQPFASFGFYSWQTNDWLNLQNDALMYAAGADFKHNSWNFSASLSGYSGYKQELDKPVRINIDVKKNFVSKAIRFQYHHGLRHWEYKTIRFSYIFKFKPVA